MKFRTIFMATVFCPLLFVSCGGDDDEPAYVPESANVNANTTVSDAIYGRLELPRLADGQQYKVLTYSTADYGVNMMIEWDCNKKAQRWTAYQMHRGNSATNWNRNSWKDTEWGGDPFQPDRQLPAEYRSEQEDYVGSGFNRGHICPSADRLCSKEMNGQTYYLTNIQPQIYDFNAGVWLTMETQVRKWNVESFRDTLFVCKGGTIDDANLVSPTKLNSNSTMKLPVPKYFFMAILCKKDGKYKAIAFWAEHKADKSTNLIPYTKSIDELEELTGIDFFCNLPDNVETTVESLVSPSSWGLK